MKIRQMTIDDYDSVVSVWRAAGLTMDPIADTKEAFNRTLKMNPTTCFVADLGVMLVGAVIGTFNGRRAWAYHLAVVPEYHGQGLGKKLLLAVEEAAKALGAAKLQLGVAWENLKVLPFYTKLGFNPQTDALWLSKTLRKIPEVQNNVQKMQQYPRLKNA